MFSIVTDPFILACLRIAQFFDEHIYKKPRQAIEDFECRHNENARLLLSGLICFIEIVLCVIVMLSLGEMPLVLKIGIAFLFLLLFLFILFGISSVPLEERVHSRLCPYDKYLDNVPAMVRIDVHRLENKWRSCTHDIEKAISNVLEPGYISEYHRMKEPLGKDSLELLSFNMLSPQSPSLIEAEKVVLSLYDDEKRNDKVNRILEAWDKTVEQVQDLSNIWTSELGILRACKYRTEEHAEKFWQVGSILGVDVKVETWLSGVPAQDILV